MFFGGHPRGRVGWGKAVKKSPPILLSAEYCEHCQYQITTHVTQCRQCQPIFIFGTIVSLAIYSLRARFLVFKTGFIFILAPTVAEIFGYTCRKYVTIFCIGYNGKTYTSCYRKWAYCMSCITKSGQFTLKL